MKPVDEARRRSRGYEVGAWALPALLLYGLVSTDASAGDAPQSPAARRNTEMQTPAHTQLPATSYPAPFAFIAPRTEAQIVAPTEFRARKPGLLEAAAATDQSFAFDAPMRRDTSIARGVSEAKTQDRVRLLTLWQSRASSLSLQAGRHGSPSLQWSTPWMHRDAGSRGLFDRWLEVSPRASGSASRGGAPRLAGALAPAKAVDAAAPIDTK